MWAFGIVWSIKMTFEEWWEFSGYNHSLSINGSVLLAFKEIAEKAWQAAQPQWQPIESAPRDGTEVILRVGDGVFAGSWKSEINYCGEAGWYASIDWYFLWYSERPVTPTHWMPLPEPPKDD